MPHTNATFSPNLTEGENQFVQHMHMWGSGGYPVGKLGRKWQFARAFGVGGTPALYPTKKKAVEAVEAYLGILRDKMAGRLEPSPDSPAVLDGPTNLVALARKHADNGAVMQSSAKVCLQDAERHLDAGNLNFAKAWALRSLGYSVGIFHVDYQTAKAAQTESA